MPNMPNTSNMSKLHLKNIHKNYGTTAVVNDLSLELRQGELVTLLGPSGCGKTTTLRMIAGFIELTAGSIEMNGQQISGACRTVPPEHRGMSMIFQSYAIWPNMTVAENVGFGLDVRRTPAAESKRRVGEMLEVVHLGHLAHRYPAELSGGQQQRVALARAMVVRPEVLLLDEPLSNLDANLREEMANEIRRLHDEFRFTTVYVTHDQSEAMTISDRIAVLNLGRLEQIDTPWNLYNRPHTPFVAGFIGRTNLVSATLRAGCITLDGLHGEVPIQDEAARDRADARVSIRPQSLYLGTDVLGALPMGRVAVVSRTYLGEYWDYVVRPLGGGDTLKVHAPPSSVLEIGHESALSVDPRGVAVVS
ncbi:ABC-type Fe3+/spermidine/putrescine transport system ATPase subunit [Variovorax boronicumulans]|uniref:ABC transporter ATP-binding protein n=1 Tax=Variovorax TaxID=34072 RepID=UPI00277EFA8C|nr:MULTISPECIES: ABC transporter ATP-binding protein [Variovorax]MDQ0032716.1 ABC-type Fe3+/spermidine/putrescine transport system ATPase subunit [Variovorax boronicumulans]MDQ0609442.1 ABC-type Fe3+/spermidine/putrescine transport system ATPase subunit [Variovorax sp. W1I1]